MSQNSPRRRLARSSFWKTASATLGAITLAARVSAQPYLHAPSVDTYARHDPNGLTILSNGRYLEPVGRPVPVARFPYGLAMSSDGGTLFVASDGVGQFINAWRGPKPGVAVIHPPTFQKRGGRKAEATNAGGADFSPDGRLLYWSSGETGAIYIFDVRSREKIAEVSLNTALGGKQYDDSYAVDVKVSRDGKHLFCADLTNFRVVVVDTEQRRVVGSVRVGRYPYALALAGNRVYVANIGLFEYSPVPPPEKDGFDHRGLTFPPFGYPSPEARDGVEFEGRKIPGLGEPNVPESFSVWGVDVSDPASPKVISRLKTGLLVGAPSDNGKTVGGSAPNFLAAQGDALFVSNGNNDLIERIDLGQKQDRRPDGASFRLPWWRTCGASARRAWLFHRMAGGSTSPNWGSMPLPFSIRRRWRCSGTYPDRLVSLPRRHFRQTAISLFASASGGSATGPTPARKSPTANSWACAGVVSVLEVPSASQLKTMTANVLAYNGMVDRRADRKTMSSPLIPTVPGQTVDRRSSMWFSSRKRTTPTTPSSTAFRARSDDPEFAAMGLAPDESRARASRRWKMSGSWSTTTLWRGSSR